MCPGRGSGTLLGMRVLPVPVVLLLGALALPAVASANTGAEAVAHLNAQRARNGIPADLVEHPTMSLGCRNHLAYQELNDTGLTHTEIEGRPGWTPEGSRTAPGSGGGEVLGFGDDWDDAWENPWSTAPIHLGLMMRPSARAAGYAHGAGGTCMRLGGAPSDAEPVPRVPAVHSVPGPGVFDVPASWSTSELPYTPAEVLGLQQPTGYNVLLWNDLTGQDDIAAATLTGPEGDVPVRWVDSRTPTPSVTNGDDTWGARTWTWGTMLLPVRPLREGQPYALQVTFADGTPYRLEFRTRTEPRSDVEGGGRAPTRCRPGFDGRRLEAVRSGRSRRVRVRATVASCTPSRARLRIRAGKTVLARARPGKSTTVRTRGTSLRIAVMVDGRAVDATTVRVRRR